MTSPLLTEDDEELLSAYLDHELSSPERLNLEQRLVIEPMLRQQLSELRRTCDLLENLPEVSLKHDFTQTTMEMVAVKLEQEGCSTETNGTRTANPIKKGLSWWFNRSTTSKYLAMGFLAILVGSFVGWRIRIHIQRNELRTIAVSAYLPMLQTFADLAVLKDLSEIPYWQDLLRDRSVRDRMLPEPPYFEELSNVRKWVGSLDAQQQSVLWDQHQELMRKDLKHTMSDVNHYLTIQAQSNSHDLLQTGTAFVALLKSMPSNRRDEILSLPRARQVTRLRQDAYYAIALDHTNELTKAEHLTIVNWGRSDFEERLRQSMPFMKDAPLERLLYSALYVLPQHSNMVLDDHEELCETLCQGLSEKSRTLFQGVAHESQTLVMMAWLLRSAGWNESKPPTTDELLDFYLEMPAEKREDIDLAEPSQALERLKNNYRVDLNFQRREKRLEKIQAGRGLKPSPPKNAQ